MINDDNNCSETEGITPCHPEIKLPQSLRLIYVVNFLIDLKYEYFFLVVFLCNITGIVVIYLVFNYRFYTDCCSGC